MVNLPLELKLEVFLICLMYWNCKVRVLEVDLCQPVSLSQQVLQSVNAVHLEMLWMNKAVEFFEVDHRSLAPIFLGYQKNVGVKIPLQRMFCDQYGLL